MWSLKRTISPKKNTAGPNNCGRRALLGDAHKNPPECQKPVGYVTLKHGGVLQSNLE